MAGIIKRITANFSLAIPRFDMPGWGSAFERNMDIIDAVLSTAGVVSGVIGLWENNTTYGVDDRIVDSDDDTVWQCEVGHTSAASGTFTADRAANPTFWSAVSPSVVVRGAFLTGTDYFIGDFVYDTTEDLGGIVTAQFTGGANLRVNIADIGVIYDLKADLAAIPTMQTDITTLQAADTALQAADTALQGRATDLESSRVSFDAVQSKTTTQQSQARTNVGMDLGYPLLHVVDEKASGANGGSSVAGAQVRDLNTVLTNEITGATLGSNLVTLPEGTYWIEGGAPAYATDRNKVHLEKSDGTVIYLTGENLYFDFAASAASGRICFAGRVVLTATTILRINHYTTQVRATNGLGVSGSVAGLSERYSDLKAWKLK